ncbi:MAG: nitrogen regulation protein NR(II) [Phycisphaerae bacterium]
MNSSCPDDFFRLICENSSAALIATDIDLNIVAWNPAAGRIFGAASPQMIGTSVLSVLPADQRAHAEDLLHRAVKEHEVNEFEFDQRDQAGDRRFFSVWVAPVVNDENRTGGVSIWVRDITRRTELGSQLAHSHKMVALGQLAGAIAHHFNNILGGMVTSVDFALAADDPHAEHRTLVQIGASLTRATRLVENLLAFAEGDQRPDDLADLTEVLINALEVVESELDDANVKLDLRHSHMPITPVPRKQMTTAIYNIVHNAIEAMPDGGLLQVELRHEPPNCLLQFKDSGCGVAEHRLNRIFEPFYSTKTTAGSDADQAIGLGLAVAHGIIQDLGGKITANSEVGVGTTLRVSIPAGPAPQTEK